MFHSFRHGFKDALRAAGVSEDLNDALTGHSGGGVGRSYGAKDVVRRFGLKQLAEAVAKAEYPASTCRISTSPMPRDLKSTSKFLHALISTIGRGPGRVGSRTAMRI